MLVLTSVQLSSVKQRSVSQIDYQHENGNQAISECKLKEGQVWEVGAQASVFFRFWWSSRQSCTDNCNSIEPREFLLYTTLLSKMNSNYFYTVLIQTTLWVQYTLETPFREKLGSGE